MKHLTKKVMACMAIVAMCCLSCKANNSADPSSSHSMPPKVKTTKKAAAKGKANNTAQANFNSPQITVAAVPSKKMGRTLNNLIVLPKQYLDNNDKSYPVVYLLNGHGGGYMDWNDLRVLPPGKGHIDFDRFYAFIGRTGYRDTFTFEATGFDQQGTVHTEMLNEQFAGARRRLAALAGIG